MGITQRDKTAKGAMTVKVAKLRIARETVKDLTPAEAKAVQGAESARRPLLPSI